MSTTTEKHATRAPDWRVYGDNLAAEAEHVGGQFADARRLMLDAWEGWTSGEPEPQEIIYELLATWQAMAVMSGISDEIVPLFNKIAAKVAKIGNGETKRRSGNVVGRRRGTRQGNAAAG